MKKILLISTILVILIASSVALGVSYYARVDTYFNVPSTASFNVAFPTSYAGAYNESANNASTNNWISFNFTTVPEEWIEPQTNGTLAQSGPGTPIFLIYNTGNVNETISVNTSAQSNFDVCANSTCDTGGCQSAVSACTAIDGVGLVTMATDLNTSVTRLNITLYGNVTAGASGGQTGPGYTFIYSVPT